MTPLPNARGRLLIKQLDDQTIVYDQLTEQMHVLDPISAIVLAMSDGQHEPQELLSSVEQFCGEENSADSLALALDRLNSAGLLQNSGSDSTASLSDSGRREVLKRLAASMALALIPTVLTSTVAWAGSLPSGSPCASGADCASTVCVASVCS